MNVVDVGANLGYFSLLAATLVGESGRVFAVEPEPKNFLLIERSVQASGFHNVEPVRMALSDRVGTERLFLAPPSEPNAHSLIKDKGLGFIDVQSSRLEDFWASRGRGQLHLLKVHVFGDDAIVFRGSMKVLREFKPMVVTRFVPSNWSQHSDLLRDILNLYDVFEIIESPFLLRPIKKTVLTSGGHKGIFLTPKR